MNWAALALGVGLAAAIVVALGARRRDGSRAGIAVAAVLVVVACLNGAAPLRGLLDPDYVGYSFGLLEARRGLAVSLVAGGVLLLSVTSAWIAATRRSGPALWIVAATCSALAVILGVPWVRDVVQDPAASRIQFGEYLTIPGLAATALMLGLIVGPLVAGAIWAARRA